MNNLQLLDKNLKKLLIYYLITLGIGFSLGVLYVYLNSEFSSLGLIEQYTGNNDEWEPKLPKTLQDLVSHTHEHITMFSIIFLSLGLIFLYTNTIKGFWKKFLILEPFVSIIITFGGFFIIRYIAINFSYIIIISSLLMYICFYVMLFICLYELMILNKEN
tara:strand:+ start:1118 stop:1600 length:483 start_codon:yes stop_codon:yes gene_type:complete